MTDDPTVYRSEITTPSGVEIRAEVVLPMGAEYDDMHELAEGVAWAVTRLVHAVDQGMIRTADDEQSSAPF